MSEWDWGLVSDVADMVTAISAVAGVFLAAMLGLKAVRIAAQDHDRGAQEFLYAQVDALLQSALALTSAASELAVEMGEGGLAERCVGRQSENFHSRLQLLRELELVNLNSEAASVCNQFAHMLVVVGKCSHGLRSDGRNLLAPTIFDGNGDGAGILHDLATRVHGYPDRSTFCGREEPGSDGHNVSPAFSGSTATAAQLRVDLADVAWRPSVDQSLRLVIPWLRTELGWLQVQAVLEDGTPSMMMDNDWGAFFDEVNGKMVLRPNPHPDAAEWLEKWPGRFWQIEDHGDDPNDNPQAWLVSPEELTTNLFNDLRVHFIARVSALVREMSGNSSPRPQTS